MISSAWRFSSSSKSIKSKRTWVVTKSFFLVTFSANTCRAAILKHTDATTAYETLPRRLLTAAAANELKKLKKTTKAWPRRVCEPYISEMVSIDF